MTPKMPPLEIERRSMATIHRELGPKVTRFSEEQLAVVMRVIHASADFDYADNLLFLNDAVTAGLEALREGCHIITDTNMALSGLSKPSMAHLGVQGHCLMADPEVAALAKERDDTRAAVSMELAANRWPQGIYVVGNAPTALFKIIELTRQGHMKPALVVGMPVGFVNVVESKEALKDLAVPSIVGLGRKGGSSVAVAAVNALLYQKWRA